MKLLYFTDSHIRGTSPKNRKDDFFQTLITKMEEIVKISVDEEVDYIFHGGDLFDRPDISISVVGTFAKILTKVKAPIYMISGNHDIFGHNPKTLNRTMLGLLSNIGIVNLVNDKKVILSKEDISIEVSGAPYIYGNDELVNKGRYIVTEKNKNVDYQIHMTHGFLVDKPFLKTVNHTLINEILDTKADITLGGHYHLGFKSQIIDGKHFLNPGSIVRIANTLIEIKRRPKVLIIDLKEGISVKEVYLKSALPGEDVLDRSEMERHKFKSYKINEFREIIEGSSNFNRVDIYELLMEISINENLPENIREEAIRRVEKIQIDEANILWCTLIKLY